jgi:hypothetical protein
MSSTVCKRGWCTMVVSLGCVLGEATSAYGSAYDVCVSLDRRLQWSVCFLELQLQKRPVCEVTPCFTLWRSMQAPSGRSFVLWPTFRDPAEAPRRRAVRGGERGRGGRGRARRGALGGPPPADGFALDPPALGDGGDELLPLGDAAPKTPMGSVSGEEGPDPEADLDAWLAEHFASESEARAM